MYYFIRPAAYYPPLLLASDFEEKSNHGIRLRLLILCNIAIRLLCFPIIVLLNLIILVATVVSSLLLSLGWLLGGWMSVRWSIKTKLQIHQMVHRCQWIIVDVLAFMWYQLKLFIGLFYTPFAITALNELKTFFEPLSALCIFHSDWHAVHSLRLGKFADFIGKHVPYFLKCAFCTFVAEPMEFFSFGFRSMKGLGRLRHYANLNPAKLTGSHLNHPILLCIHGNYHDQSAWAPFIHYLRNKKYPGAIYTIDLPSGDVTDADITLINQKIVEIQASFRAANGLEDQLKINLIGHSRGALIAYAAGFTHWQIEEKSPVTSGKLQTFINKVILLGKNQVSPTEYHISNSPIYINGRYDILIPFTTPPEVYGHVIKTGHLGLLSHPDVFEICYTAINQ